MEKVAALSIMMTARLGALEASKGLAWGWKPKICPLTYWFPLTHVEL